MFAIRQTRHFYGPITQKSMLIDEDGGELHFETRSAAQAYIDELNDSIYYLGHHASGRPEYKIVPIK